MLILIAATTFAAPPPTIETGKAVYAAKCLACHGDTGNGDGPAVRALKTPPADLSDPTYWKGRDLEVVRAIIRSGKPGTVMRGFPMPPKQEESLLLYLQSFATPAN